MKIILENPSANPATNQINLQIFEERIAANHKSGMVEGDVLVFNDGSKMRIASILENTNSIQPAWGGSFYLNSTGSCSMSGSLCCPIPSDQFELATEMIEAPCWIFSENISGAGRGVSAKAPFKTWRQKPGEAFSPKWEWTATYCSKQEDGRYFVSPKNGCEEYLSEEGLKIYMAENALKFGRKDDRPDVFWLIPNDVKDPNQ